MLILVISQTRLHLPFLDHHLIFQHIDPAYLFFSGLLFQRKLNISLFNIFKKFSGVGIVNKCVNLETIKVFITVIFPNGVKCRVFQLLIIFRALTMALS